MGFCGTLRHREFYIRVCDAIFHRQRSLTISTVPFSALIVIVMQGVGGREGRLTVTFRVQINLVVRESVTKVLACLFVFSCISFSFVIRLQANNLFTRLKQTGKRKTANSCCHYKARPGA